MVINNLGGMSNLELAVMANATIRYLGVSVVYCFSDGISPVVDVKKTNVTRA